VQELMMRLLEATISTEVCANEYNVA